MTVYRCILPDWAKQENPSLPKVKEGVFTDSQLLDFNEQHYNCYFYPNYPQTYTPGTNVDGSHIDTFEYVFVDLDSKDYMSTDKDRSHQYATKDDFINHLLSLDLKPSSIVDSGNGVHAYWRVNDLDAMSYLRLQRRLCRYLRTDPEVAKIAQLMRVSETINTKYKDAFQLCTQVYSSENSYTCEQLDKMLPSITHKDEEYCIAHHDKVRNTDRQNVKIDTKLPLKFSKLLASNNEVKDIWTGNSEDRSKSDYRLGHIMYANKFTRDEAISVLVNTVKALARAPIHRVSYASNIVDKIWVYEESEQKEFVQLSSSVKDILNSYGDEIKGERIPCWTYIDNTVYGFRLGMVLGLVAGSGVGKTAISLNAFEGFVRNNPNQDHFFVSLEMPVNQIAGRWKALCGDDRGMLEKVHIIGNHNPDGTYRDLSLDDIEEYIVQYQERTKRKVGCVVIDHIGVLNPKTKVGNYEDVKAICKRMKAFAIKTNTFLIMQSQAPREKAGWGDLELNKDAAYGTSFFENFCDFVVTIWQPLKRCHKEEGCPKVTAFKFAKIREQNPKDVIVENELYRMYFDAETQHLRQMTQDEETSFDFFNKKCVNLRKTDRKTEVLTYTSVKWEQPEPKKYH